MDQSLDLYHEIELDSNVLTFLIHSKIQLEIIILNYNLLVEILLLSLTINDLK